MKSVYIKNTIILSVCMLISKMLGALYRIPLSNILGTEGMGLYQMVFPVYSLFLVFITGGMPVYLSQRISHFRAKGQTDKIYFVLKNAILLSLIISVLFCGLIIVLSKPISLAQGNKDAYLGYITVALSIIFSAVSCVYKGYFNGYENMQPSAISGIVEQSTKLICGILLTYLLKPLGTIYAVSGAFLGVLVSEVICFLYMLVLFFKHKQRQNYIKVKFNIQTTKSIFWDFLPISASNLILPLSSCIDTFLVVNMLTLSGFAQASATSLFGIATGMVGPLVNFPILLCGTVATAMLPSVSYLISKKQDVSGLIGGTYFFVLFLCLPCAVGIIALAPNIIEIFFPAIENIYQNIAIKYLCILSLNIIFMSVATLSTSVLNSHSKFKQPLIAQIVSFCSKFIVLIPLLFVSKINILALAIAVVISNAIYFFVCACFVKKFVKFSINSKTLSFLLINSILMFILIVYLNNILIFNKMLKTFILVVLGIIFYLFLSILFKLISIKQIKQLIFNNAKN